MQQRGAAISKTEGHPLGSMPKACITCRLDANTQGSLAAIYFSLVIQVPLAYSLHNWIKVGENVYVRTNSQNRHAMVSQFTIE